MKGIVFTEFLEMVEEKFSPDLVDRIVEEAKLVVEAMSGTLKAIAGKATTAS